MTVSLARGLCCAGLEAVRAGRALVQPWGHLNLTVSPARGHARDNLSAAVTCHLAQSRATLLSHVPPCSVTCHLAQGRSVVMVSAFNLKWGGVAGASAAWSERPSHRLLPEQLRQSPFAVAAAAQALAPCTREAARPRRGAILKLALPGSFPAKIAGCREGSPRRVVRFWSRSRSTSRRRSRGCRQV